MTVLRALAASSRASLGLLVVIGSGLLFSCDSGGDGNATPDSLPDIAFLSLRDGNSEIYLMEADGSHPRNLTNHPGDDYAPIWSPSGARIAFGSLRDGNTEIYSMNADGSSPKNLTDQFRSDCCADKKELRERGALLAEFSRPP